MKHRADGAVAGLCNYSAHRGVKTRKCETVWTARLAELLGRTNVRTALEQRYPDDGRKCDLLVFLDGDRSLWVEVKAAWKAWYSANKKCVQSKNPFYRPYLFGPDDGGLDKSHSVAQDIEKLLTLKPPHAHFVAELVIGFDCIDDPMESEIEELKRRLKKMDKNSWNEVTPLVLIDPNDPTCRICCWFWWKPAAASRPSAAKSKIKKAVPEVEAKPESSAKPTAEAPITVAAPADCLDNIKAIIRMFNSRVVTSRANDWTWEECWWRSPVPLTRFPTDCPLGTTRSGNSGRAFVNLNPHTGAPTITIRNVSPH